MNNIATLLVNAKGKVCDDGWEEANRALRKLSWKKAILHERAPEWAYWYAKDVLKSPWPVGEKVILKSPQWSYYYARVVLRNLWPEGEKTILKSPEWSRYYAEAVLRREWPERERRYRKVIALHLTQMK